MILPRVPFLWQLNKILRNSSFLSSISWFEKTQCGVAKGKENILKHISGCADFTPRPPTVEMSSTILPSWAWLQWLLLNIQRISATQDCIHKHNRGGPLFCYRLNICCFLHAFLKRFTSFLLEKPQQRSARVGTIWMCVRMLQQSVHTVRCSNQEMRRGMNSGMRTAAGRLGLLCIEDTQLGECGAGWLSD